MNPLDPVVARPAPLPHRGLTALLALLGALVPAAILAARASAPLPLAALPAITFGVPAMTAPALYVALTLLADAPPMMAVAAAIGRGLLALALVQLGLAAPVGFLVATASPDTTPTLIAAAVALAGAVAVIAVDAELRPADACTPTMGRAVAWAWIATTALITARLYADALAGVTS